MANKVVGIEDGSSGGEISLEPGSGGLFFFLQKNGERVYYVLAQDIDQTEDQIVATTGIPQIGDTLNGAPVRKLKGQEQQRVRHPTSGAATILWKVTVTTDTRFDSSTNNPSDDPTDYRPRRRWYTQKEKMRIEKDVNGDIIETANHEPIIYERPVVKINLEIERYETYPTSPTAIYNYANHCNNATFYGAPIGSCLLDDIQSTEEVINGVTYIKVVYVFVFFIKFDGASMVENTLADVEIAHEGYLVRPSAGAVPATVLDKNGHPRKCNLNEDGTENTTDVQVTVIFPDLPLADFSALNLEF